MKFLLVFLLSTSTLSAKYVSLVPEEETLFYLTPAELTFGENLKQVLYHQELPAELLNFDYASFPHLALFQPWITALQVIEQSPDLATFLKLCPSRQKNTGIIRRYKLHNSFDLFCSKRAAYFFEWATTEHAQNRKLTSYLERSILHLFQEKKWDQFQRVLTALEAETKLMKRVRSFVREDRRIQTAKIPYELYPLLGLEEPLPRMTSSKVPRQKRKPRTRIHFNLDKKKAKAPSALKQEAVKLYQELNLKPRPQREQALELFFQSLLEKEERIKFKRSYNFFRDLNRDLVRTGEFPYALELTHILFDKTRKFQEDDSLFLLMWTYLNQDKVAELYDFLEDEEYIKNYWKLSERNQFWLASVIEQEKGLKKAKFYYQKIINRYPLGYYAIICSKKIKKKPERPLYWISKKKIPPLLTGNLNIYQIQALKRIALWSNIQLHHFLYRDSEIFDKYIKHHQASQLHLKFSLIKKGGSHLPNFSLVRLAMAKRHLPLAHETLELLYPEPFTELLTTYSRGLDRRVIQSLMRQESSFNPRARSYVGATGLMQLMPTTARGIEPDVTLEQLRDPETNIRIGTHYLSFLYRRYKGNLVYSFAGYNAGEGRVDRWDKFYFPKKDNMLLTIETIPFRETRNYVKLIFRNLYHYKSLYEPETFQEHQEIKQFFDVQLF